SAVERRPRRPLGDVARAGARKAVGVDATCVRLVQRVERRLSEGRRHISPYPSLHRILAPNPVADRLRPMVLSSQVERDSDLFDRRSERMRALVEELRERTALVAQGGGEASVERHRSRGKLTARERIDLLVDPGSALLELSALAAWDLYDGQAPAAGIVTGIGVVEGRECVVVANDATVKGGSYFPLTVKKHLRAQEIAAQ